MGYSEGKQEEIDSLYNGRGSARWEEGTRTQRRSVGEGTNENKLQRAPVRRCYEETYYFVCRLA